MSSGSSVSGSASASALVPVEPGDQVSVGFNYVTPSGTVTATNTNSRTSLSIFEKPDLTSMIADLGVNKTQTKVLSANVTSDGAIAELGFSGLTVGKKYHLCGKIAFIAVAAGDSTARLDIVHNGAYLDRVVTGNRGS